MAVVESAVVAALPDNWPMYSATQHSHLEKCESYFLFLELWSSMLYVVINTDSQDETYIHCR